MTALPLPADQSTRAAPSDWPVLLAVHAVVWAAAAWLSHGNLDLQGDMVENFAWGQEWQFGYAKHPPLFAWVAAAWFAMLPHTDVVYFVLSALNAAVGLSGVAMLAQRFGSRQTATLAVLALAVSPLYTTLAIKFNANAVLLSTWPWTAYFFVVWMQDARPRHALAFGACAALTLLGKYFSVVLLLALLVAMLVRPAWRSRWRGLGPWLAAVGFGLVLAPHVAWLIQNEFATFGYAAQRSAGSLAGASKRYLNYSVAQLGYLLPSLALALLAVAPGQRQRAAVALAQGSARPRQWPDLWWLSFAPLIVVGVIALLARTPMASVWGMAQWFAVTTLWVAAMAHAGVDLSVARMVKALKVYWLLVIVGAVAMGYLSAQRGTAAAAEPRAELALAAQALWRQRTGQPLRVVSGSAAEAGSIVFYATDPAHWWSLDEPQTTPWLSAEQVRHHGALIVCAGEPGGCDAAAVVATGRPPEVVSVQKQAWGRPMAPRSYRLYLWMPQAAPA